jgi:SAM-dependent methyltransferase
MYAIEENWDSMSIDYDHFTDSPNSYSNVIEWPCIKKILPDLENRNIIDIGCGSGRYSFYFDSYSPKFILGIDISQKMIDLANQKRNENLKIRFRKCSIDDISTLKTGKYDFAFSSTASHYWSDLNKAFHGIYNVLCPNGVFILSAMHPIYTASYPLVSNGEYKLRYSNREIREYIQPWTKFSKKVDKEICKSFHYTISDYCNNLINVGFRIERIDEPIPPNIWKETNNERYEQTINEPLFLIIKCTK